MRPVLNTFFFGILFFFHSSLLLAESQYPLFEVDVPVISRDDQQRVEGIMRGMTIVLSRFLAPGSPAGESLRQDPSRYVREYRYSFIPDPDAAASADAGQEGSPEAGQHILTINFDANAIQAVLRREKVAVWDGVRPDVLVWMVIEQNGQRQILRPENNGDWMGALATASRQQGLNLTLPLMDLSDNMNIRPDDIVTVAEDKIRQASERYSAPVIATAYLRQEGNNWSARWSLPEQSYDNFWDGFYPGRDAALQDFMAGIYKRLFNEYASNPNNSDSAETMSLEVVELRDLNDFAKVSNYLASLSMVIDVAWRDIRPDSANFVVKLRTSSDMLRRNLQLDRQLMLVDPYATPPQYRLLQ